MKKRILLLLLTLCAALTVLSACGNTNESDPTEATGNAVSETTKTEQAKTEPAATEPAASEKEPAEAPAEQEDVLPADVTADYWDGAQQELPGAIRFTADESDFRTQVIIRADKTITSFKFLGLTFASIDNSGRVSYSMKELYRADALTPDTPFIAEMTFHGALPSYGFSYIDADGTLKCLSVNQSGEDGSVFLTEF